MKLSWLSNIQKILDSEKSDLRSLAKVAGADPNTFYMWQNLSGCDLRGEDLRGMNLVGTDILEDQLDDFTLIDREFDPRFLFRSQYLSFRVSDYLWDLICEYAEDRHYVYMAWAVKALVESGFSVLRSGNDFFRPIYDAGEVDRMLNIEDMKYRWVQVRVSADLQESIFKFAKSRYGLENSDIYPELIFIGIIHYLSNKNKLRYMSYEYLLSAFQDQH